MNARGFTILEALLAAAVLSVLLIAVSGFYLMTVRYGNQDAALMAVHRQATFVIDEMARQIGPATALSFPVTCGGDPNGLQVTNSCGTFCFHRDSTTGTQLLEDRAPNGTCPGQTAGSGTMNLLTGALVPAGGAAGLLTTVNTACSSTGGGFCPSKIVHQGTNCVVGAAVTFRLRAQLPYSAGVGTTASYQAMTFSTSIAGRALPIPISPATTCP
jgi:type II secretory pathway pseudopilin PulG